MKFESLVRIYMTGRRKRELDFEASGVSKLKPEKNTNEKGEFRGEISKNLIRSTKTVWHSGDWRHFHDARMNTSGISNFPLPHWTITSIEGVFESSFNKQVILSHTSFDKLQRQRGHDKKARFSSGEIRKANGGCKEST